MEKFREILAELKRIKEEEELENLNDDMLFDGAVRIYNSEIISSGRKQKSENREKMSEKQKVLLQDLEYRGDMNLSKREATDIISEYLARKQKRILN